jgi:hypothetical protein
LAQLAAMKMSREELLMKLGAARSQAPNHLAFRSHCDSGCERSPPV